MKLNTNKEKGNAGLSMAIAYFGANGYAVSLPLNDTQDYDLIVDDGNELYKVQAKCTDHKPSENSYEVALRSTGGTKGTVYKTVKSTNIQLLFVLCGDGTMYVIPKSVIKNCNTITLRKEKSKFAKKDDIDYSQYIVNF